MIFLTLGTQDKEFPRLLKAVEKQIKKGNITDEVVAQVGNTRYNTKTENFKLINFTNEDEFLNYIKKADFIITHAGVGTIVTALELKKKIIAVPRLSKYGEHTNDHQKQLLKEFSKKGFIIPVTDLNKPELFEEALEKVKDFVPNSYKKNNAEFVKKLENAIMD